jgi:rod shape-determining protein MreC
LVLASITIITLDYHGDLDGTVSSARRYANEAFSPLASTTDDVLRPIGNFVGGIIHYHSVAQTNAKLNEEIAQLKNEATSASEYQAQLKLVLGLDNLPWVGSIPTVPAEVTADNSSDFASTINLDKGMSSGVLDGMPVVSSGGLVGTVTQVWSGGSTVTLIDDPSITVGVRLGTQTATALVTGKGYGSSLEVDDVAIGTPLTVGTTLFTSGLQNAQYPGGIPVAKVTSVSTEASSDQETVSAKPLSALGDLQYVEVLQSEPS